MGKNKDAWRPGLRRALKKQTPVRLTRRIRGTEALDGYVVGIGRKWVLVLELYATRTDGYVAVRLTDIARLQPRRRPGLCQKVARARGTWPPAAPGAIDLDTTRRLIATAHNHAVLVALHPERTDADGYFVGVPGKWGARSLRLTEISPTAVWDGTISRWRYAQITRVEFSSTYEDDLLLVGGPPPQP